ncbi:stage II sporulation protein R [Eubacteriales bacterium OttesenSCG-928-K08]|nr:stage II sporulation protein R [Eubacteriales bacterium OttesenSCG-928-K08]
MSWRIRSITLLLGSVLCVWLCAEASSPRVFAGQVTAVQAQAAQVEEEKQDVLRLHIVANSDDAEDQRVKLLVRDALLEGFSPANSLYEAESLLLKEGSGVLETVEEVLRQENCGYGAQLRFGQMEFPDRTYGDTFYPAGVYEALRVELGDASGQNWWCVLFPPICLVDIAVQDIEGTDELVFESDILNFLKTKPQSKAQAQ